MSKISLDIALLPSDDVMEMCIDLANKAYERRETPFPKSKTERAPHISVLMGCMEENDFKKAAEKTKEVLRNFKPLNLELIGVIEEVILVSKTDEIVKLQNQLIKHVDPLLTHDCALESLLEEEDYEFTEDSKLYANTYLQDSTFENFIPHITTHNPQMEKENLNFPIKFTADRMVICHMGDRGTCKKILREYNLRKSAF